MLSRANLLGRLQRAEQNPLYETKETIVRVMSKKQYYEFLDSVEHINSAEYIIIINDFV